jgi:DNA-binding LacI/PurR family transcriptional regulator
MPAREMGEIAAAKMIHLLERQAVEEKTELDVELVVRNSTAPPIGALGREG